MSFPDPAMPSFAVPSLSLLCGCMVAVRDVSVYAEGSCLFLWAGVCLPRASGYVPEERQGIFILTFPVSTGWQCLFPMTCVSGFDVLTCIVLMIPYSVYPARRCLFPVVIVSVSTEW